MFSTLLMLLFSQTMEQISTTLSDVIIALVVWKKSSLDILMCPESTQKQPLYSVFVDHFLSLSFFLQTGFKRSRLPSRKAPDYSQR